SRPIVVSNDARLTIEAGTTILGEQGSALIVSPDGFLDAQGSPSAPIVFTSASEPGDRSAGDWGGLALLGWAPALGEARPLQGLVNEVTRAVYGGDTAPHNCGILSYVRVEFAGSRVSADEGLDALTLAGCGTKTVVDRVQVHRALNDGVQVLGGRVGLQHLLVTGSGEDGLDWDQGWQGVGQFIVVQQQIHTQAGAVESAIHGRGADRPDGAPRSMPFLSNVTLIGPGSGRGLHVGMTLSDGTAGQLVNVLSVGFGGDIYDVADPETALVAEREQLGVRAVVAHDIGADGRTPFRPEIGDDDDDDGFDEQHMFEDPASGNRMVSSTLLTRAASDVEDPDFIPLATVWVDSTAAERPPEGPFWDESARFIGAMEPGSSPNEAWYSAWARFPLD
ncbi:MAG: hypothetical protein AB8H79_09020, partial [Myxococcota bacterium]